MCGVAARLRRPSLAVLGISGVVLIWLSSIAGSEAKTVRGKTQAFVEGQNECKQMNCYTALNNAPKTRWKGNRGNTRYLGSFHSVSDCESACLSYKDRRGRRCQSFVYHDKELSKMCFSKRKCFDSQCFAVLNNFWSPVATEHVITGRTGYIHTLYENGRMSSLPRFLTPSVYPDNGIGVVVSDPEIQTFAKDVVVKQSKSVGVVAVEKNVGPPDKVEKNPKLMEHVTEHFQDRTETNCTESGDHFGTVDEDQPPAEVVAQVTISAVVITMCLGAFMIGNRQVSIIGQKTTGRRQLFRRQLSLQGKVEAVFGSDQEHSTPTVMSQI